MNKSLRGKRSALLLVDFINLFDFEDSHRLAPRAVKAARAVARVKEERGYSLCIYANDNFGDWKTEFSALVNRSLEEPGASGAIAQSLRPEANDVTVLKPRHSAFYGTPLDFILEEEKIKKLIICGIAADRCVLATAHDAFLRQFEIHVPSNCIAGFSAREEKLVLELMARTLKANVTSV